MEKKPETEVLTPQQLYESLCASLKQTEGVDTDVLAVIQDELLHPAVDDKSGAKKALDRLIKLASDRTELFT